jgi:hypothetical protein
VITKTNDNLTTFLWVKIFVFVIFILLYINITAFIFSWQIKALFFGIPVAGTVYLYVVGGKPWLLVKEYRARLQVAWQTVNEHRARLPVVWDTIIEHWARLLKLWETHKILYVLNIASVCIIFFF